MKTRKQKMLKMRLGGKTLAEVGAEFNVSDERVRQIIGNTRHLYLLREMWMCPVCKKWKMLSKEIAKQKKTCSKECRIKNNKFGIPSNHPDYVKLQSRGRWKDPKYRKKRKLAFRIKWWSDSEWREKKKAQMRIYYRQHCKK